MNVKACIGTLEVSEQSRIRLCTLCIEFRNGRWSADSKLTTVSVYCQQLLFYLHVLWFCRSNILNNYVHKIDRFNNYEILFL